MKKILLTSTIILLIATAIQAQQPQPVDQLASSTVTSLTPRSFNQVFMANNGYNTPEKDQAFYKRQSKTQLTIGLVLLGTGLVSSGAALLVANGNDVNSNNGSTIATLFVIGAATGIASIPFMAMSLASHNKAKAFVNNQKTGLGSYTDGNKDVTGVTLSIPIGR